MSRDLENYDSRKQKEFATAPNSVNSSEWMLRQVLDSISHGVFWKDRQSRYLGCNRVVATAFGLGSPEEIVGLDDHQLAGLTREQAENFVAIDRSVIERNKPALGMIDQARFANGSTVWLETNKFPMRDSTGNAIGVLGTWQDITARKHAEEGQARLAAIVESCEDAIISKSLDGTILSWNAGAERLFGYASNEAIGQSIMLIVPPDRVAEQKELLVRLSRGERLQHFETVRMTRDGRRFDFSLTISPIRNAKDQIVGASKIARNISEQNRARRALQQREALLQSATDNAAVGLVMLNRDRRYIFVNAAYLRILSLPWTAEELINKLPSELFGEVYDSQIAPQLDRAYAGETVKFEFTLARENGKMQHYMVVYDPMLDGLGAVDRVIVTVCDITERKLAEASIRESQNRLEFALESSQIGAWDLDLRDCTAFRSLQHDRIFGYPELVPKWTYEMFLEHVLPEDREQVDDKFRRCLATQGDWIFECRIRRTDKQVRWIWVAGRQRFDEAGVPRRIAGVIQDTTERHQALEDRQRLESQIQHAQKLESLGVLAGGIAHDFNNILTSILGYTDLALMELPNHSPARPWIAEAVNGACKAADLTKQMLAYSGKGKFVVEALSLNDVIEDMVQLLQVSITKKCQLQLQLMPDLASIEADATQMRQVIMNLIINASDAIGERSGVIAITTGVMYCDRAYLAESYLDENLKEGLYAYVEVADTGCGMSDETRARIFDPFFTTKAAGRGLGLAAVLGIVRGHLGTLKVYSEVGKGTTFKVAFPAVNPPAHLDPTSGVTVKTWTGSGTVLVVDDEETVRGLLRHLFETMGFTVLTANDGREGVAIFRRESDAIRLVVLDMTMPILDGPETFRELRRIRGDVKAILTSGYSEQSAISQFAGKGLSGFIQKPFRYDELLAIVRKVFES